MSCNSTTHATCPLALPMYSYNELQMSFATQKLSCKASCKTPLFHSDYYFSQLWNFLKMHCLFLSKIVNYAIFQNSLKKNTSVW